MHDITRRLAQLGDFHLYVWITVSSSYFYTSAELLKALMMRLQSEVDTFFGSHIWKKETAEQLNADWL